MEFSQVYDVGRWIFEELNGNELRRYNTKTSHKMQESYEGELKTFFISIA